MTCFTTLKNLGIILGKTSGKKRSDFATAYGGHKICGERKLDDHHPLFGCNSAHCMANEAIGLYKMFG